MREDAKRMNADSTGIGRRLHAAFRAVIADLERPLTEVEDPGREVQTAELRGDVAQSFRRRE